MFFYDTINRTTLSKLIFIKPGEMKSSITRHALEHREISGTRPPGNPLRMIMAMRRYNTGKISAPEFERHVGGS